MESEEICKDSQPWQWQEAIASVAQVRCCLVEDRIWSVLWKRTVDQEFADFRELNEIEEKECEWEKIELHRNLQDRLLTLCKILNIHSCCPEFLVTKGGDYVLVDLNPCGDWYGFFDDETHGEIADGIANMLADRA